MSELDANQLHVETTTARRISAIWIVPIAAALLGGMVAWRSLADRGPLVEIRFSEAKGIKADKTEIKHKDVVIGIVEDVRFAEDLDGVVVSARLDPEIEPYLGDTTDFWIVSANISGTDLSGLSTILSGSYIEVDWSAVPQERRRQFDGLTQQPLTPPGVEGRRIVLTAPQAASVSVGSPIYFRGIAVGRIENRTLSDDFRLIEYAAFVEAPYDTLIQPNTLFWNVSGLNVNAGTDGLSINIASLETLLAGGVTFGNLLTDLSGRTVEENHQFRLYQNREAAVESQYANSDEPGQRFSLTFGDSVAGLEPGAPVEWQGIRIGTVIDLQLNIDTTTADALVNVIIELQPSRIGIDFQTLGEAQASMQEWVDSGMRVRLATGNILTGKKLIRFVDGIATEPAQIDFAAQPYPSLPTAPSELDALAADAEELVQNLAELPLDALVTSAVRLLDNTNAFVANPDMASLPGELNATLSTFEAMAGNLNQASQNLPLLIENLNQIADAGESTLTGLSPDSQLYVDLSSTVRDLRDAARSLSALAIRLEEQPNSLIMGRN